MAKKNKDIKYLKMLDACGPAIEFVSKFSSLEEAWKNKPLEGCFTMRNIDWRVWILDSVLTLYSKSSRKKLKFNWAYDSGLSELRHSEDKKYVAFRKFLYSQHFLKVYWTPKIKEKITKKYA